MANADSPFPPKTDLYTRRGAEMLVEQIVAYWRARGCQVAARTYRIPGLSSLCYGVRSNLVNGLPRRLA